LSFSDHNSKHSVSHGTLNKENMHKICSVIASNGTHTDDLNVMHKINDNKHRAQGDMSAKM